MSGAPAVGHYVIDEDDSIIVSSVSGAEYKTETETITGFVATNGVDKVNDRFTKDALKDIAKQIKADVDTVDAYFADVDSERADELEQFDSTVGNTDHNNNPKLEKLGLGDPRIVPAFKITGAEYVEDPSIDGVGAGVKVTAELNTAGNPEDVREAIRNSIKNGFVDSLSIEYKAEDTTTRVIDGEPIRLLKSVIVNGAAITGRPANPEARLTNFNLKSLVKQETLADLDLVPPEGAQESAQRALDWREEYPDEIEGMTETGWNRAEQLASGEELEPADIADGTDGMANWWARHEENFELDDEFEGEPWRDAGYVAGLGWGGEPGKNWAMRMKETIEDIRDSDEKSMHIEDKAMIQTPEYAATNDSGQWSRPDAQDFPEDYDPMDIFLVRNEDSDNFSDQSLPVVDMRDGEPTLVSGGLESAHRTASRVDGLTDDEVEQARDKAEALLEEEFGRNPFEDGNKNTMGESDTPEVTQEDLNEVKSQFEERIADLEDQNESLQDENEELKSQLEDLETIEEVKNEIDQLEDELGDVKSDVEPLKEQGTSKYDSELEQYLAKTVDIASVDKVQEQKSMIAQDHGVTEEQVDEALESVTEGDH